MTGLNETIPDCQIAEFLELAESAHIYFDVINGRLTMRAVNPNWDMWRPCRHLLDEIGSARIAAFLRAAHAQPQSMAS